MQTLLKAIPESMFRHADFAVRTLAVSGRSLYTVNQVSESCFVRLLAGFSKLDMTVNILSSSSAAYWKGYHSYNWLTETW
jgi:hypothetical protein